MLRKRADLSRLVVFSVQLVLAATVLDNLAQAQTPIGQWKFDEGGGTTAYDSSGNGDHALLSSGIRWVAGVEGWAISADARNRDSVEIPALDLGRTKAVTVAFWELRDYTTESNSVFFEAGGNYQTSTTGFALLPDDETCHGIQAALRGNAGTTANCYSQPSSGVWHHLAVVFDKTQTGGNQVALYLDGVLQTPSRNLASATNTNFFGYNSIYLFSRGATSQYGSGTVTDLRIYSSALTAPQVQQLYNGRGSTAPTTPISYVQGNYATPQTPQTTVNVTFRAAQSAGDLNVVVVGWNDSTARVSWVRDSKGNLYTLAVGPTIQSGLASQSIYYAKNIVRASAGTNSVTVTFSTPARYPDIRILEYRGADTKSPIDVTAANSGNSSTSNSGSATTTNGTDLIFGANLVQMQTAGPGSGFMRRLLTSPDGDIAEDEMSMVKGRYSATAPVTPASPWIMQMVAFRTPGDYKGKLTASPASLNFATVNVDSSATLTATLTNTGTASLTVSGVSITGAEFSLSSVTTPFALAPNASKRLTATFSPTVTGAASGNIIVNSDAIGPTLSIPLSGTAFKAVKHSVTLTWDASKSKVVGYNIYRSSNPNGGFTILNNHLIPLTTYVDDAVHGGYEYYYYATAVNSQGQESVPSNHVLVTVP